MAQAVNELRARLDAADAAVDEQIMNDRQLAAPKKKGKR